MRPPEPPHHAPITAPTRAGHVALAGRPNVGKSSLLNAIVGDHLALVSPKAQATRLPVTGIHSTPDTQFIFHDLPGLLEPAYLLHERMREAAIRILRKVDVILYLTPATARESISLMEAANLNHPPTAPVIQVLTKADLLDQQALGRLPAEAWPVSATTRAGIPDLLAEIRRHLPVAPFPHDPEQIGTQPLRFFAAEYVREAAFETLADELPYALAAEIEEFRESSRPIYIRVTIVVERESQKGIVIGRGGRTIKAIGQHARARLEQLTGEPVYLDLWTKVMKNWRKKPGALGRLGFPAADKESE